MQENPNSRIMANEGKILPTERLRRFQYRILPFINIVTLSGGEYQLKKKLDLLQICDLNMYQQRNQLNLVPQNVKGD